MNELYRNLPPMKSGQELCSALEVLPAYTGEITTADAATRLMALSALYGIYVPSQMSMEIYSKLYLALLRSLQKKGTKLAVQQMNQNFQAIQKQEYNGILGGADSFTIIGASGIGKSSAISRAITLITENRIVEAENPYTKILPCVCVQCPFDSSVKGLLLEILRKLDEGIGCSYYTNALRARSTTDMLIGSVSQAALHHIGLLVVDEIQNVVGNKNGKSLVGMLTQLINNSGISICMVGTPECTVFFEQAMQLARRSLGLQYEAMAYGRPFKAFCETLFRYRYVRKEVELTESMLLWLYEHSGGNISVVVSLLHDAQEIAILNGTESLDLVSLQEAYTKRLSMLHGFIPARTKKQTTKSTKSVSQKCPISRDTPSDICISDIAAKAKSENTDVVQMLKEHIPIDEVRI